MNATFHSEITVTEPLPDRAVGGTLEPRCRQSHHEDRSSTDDSTDYDHSIGRELLRKRADNWHQQNDQKIIDGRELTDRSAVPQFANAELGEHVIHLQENELEKSNQEKKNKEPVKHGLTEQPPKQPDGIASTVTDG